MRRTLIAGLLTLGLVPAVEAAGAPGVDVTLGAYGWDAQPSGTFATTDSRDTEVDLEDDLDFGSNRNDVFSIALEHPVPFIPNVRVASANISDTQASTLQRQITYAGRDFGTTSERVTSEYQMDYTEATFYYSPWKGVTRFDIGITARRIDAEFAIRSRERNASESVAVKTTVPMIHAGVRADLPLSGFHVKGKVDAASYNGNSLTDATAALGWRSNFNLGLELGYRRMALTLDDVEDLDTDADLDGPYLSLSVAI